MRYQPVVTRREFLGASVLAVSGLADACGAEGTPRKKLVLLAGSPSHGPGAHEFNAGVALLHKCLADVQQLEVSVHRDGWPKKDADLDEVAGSFLYADGGGNHPFLRGKRLELLDGLMKKGVGLMCAHYAVEVPKDLGSKQMLDWIGGYYETYWSCNPHWTAEFEKLPDHPICRGVSPFSIRDEWYFNMRFRPEMKDVVSILSAKPSDEVRKGNYASPKGPYEHIIKASGNSETLMWAVERPDGGRGVGFTGGHYHQNWRDDNFRKLVLNALVWICKVEVPDKGVVSLVTDEDMKKNLDPKGTE